MSGLITIVGNIGSGKTSLTRRLADALGWEPWYETVQDNPYLADFYGDMQRWSFHLQIYFLSQRFNQHLDMARHPRPCVQDRSVYEDMEIFCRALQKQGQLDGRDFEHYEALYRQLVALIPPPDLVIYLKADVPTLKERIRRRGRDFEQSIDPGYLELLNDLYSDWVTRIDWAPVLTIAMDDLDFVASGDDFHHIRHLVQQSLQPARVG